MQIYSPPELVPGVELRADVWGLSNIVIHRLEQKVDGDSETLFIAFLNNQFAGSVVAKIMECRACSIRMLFVSLRHRRAGVATALLNELTEWARKQDAEGLEVIVLKDNGPARQFYIRKGKFIDNPTVAPGVPRASEYVVMERPL